VLPLLGGILGGVVGALEIRIGEAEGGAQPTDAAGWVAAGCVCLVFMFVCLFVCCFTRGGLFEIFARSTITTVFFMFCFVLFCLFCFLFFCFFFILLLFSRTLPSFEDQVYLFEATGLLIGGEGVEDGVRAQYFDAFLTPLSTRAVALADAIAAAGAGRAVGSAPCDSDLAVIDVGGERCTVVDAAEAASKMVAALAHITKGLSAATCDLAFTAQYLTTSLEATLKVLTVAGGIAQVVPRSIFYLHRMVTCLREALLPYVSTFMDLLVRTNSLRELTDTVRFSSQVTSKFKGAVAPLWDAMLMPLVTRIFDVVRDGVPSSTDRLENEQADLQRVYFHLLSTIVSSDCAGALATEANMPHFASIVATVTEGCTSHATSTQKVCFSVLQRIVREWASRDGFAEFAFSAIVPTCFSVPLSAEFDVKDAATMLVLSEIAAVHRAMAQTMPAYPGFLTSTFFPRASIPGEVAAQFAAALVAPDVKFKSFFRSFVVGLRNEQQQQQQQQQHGHHR
jgi:hypothetical protein